MFEGSANTFVVTSQQPAEAVGQKVVAGLGYEARESKSISTLRLAASDREYSKTYLMLAVLITFFTLFCLSLVDMSAKMKERDIRRLEKFRENLTRLREERGLSQRGLSYLCDVTHSKISKLEGRQDSNLNLTTLFELAKGLGVHPRELIDYEFDFVSQKAS